jgi:hypothetical protein
LCLTPTKPSGLITTTKAAGQVGSSHRTGAADMGGPCLSGVLDMIFKIDDWYAEKFAFLVGQLDSFVRSREETRCFDRAT